MYRILSRLVVAGLFVLGDVATATEVNRSGGIDLAASHIAQASLPGNYDDSGVSPDSPEIASYKPGARLTSDCHFYASAYVPDTGPLKHGLFSSRAPPFLI